MRALLLHMYIDAKRGRRLLCTRAGLMYFGVSRRSDLHADIPCTPDDGAQVANGNAVTDAVHVTALVANRSRHEADAVDDVVASDLEGLAVLTLDGDATRRGSR